MKPRVLACLLSAALAVPLIAAPAQDNLEPVEPFQIFDNLYYVGLEAVSAFVLETSDGLILVDALYPPSADHVPRAMEELGLDPTDIRHVIVTHAHIDHAGGAAAIQALTGARVGMAEADWDFYAQGGYVSSRGAQRIFPPLERDWVIQDGETLTLGDTSVALYVTPGHTAGVVSLRFTVKDGGREHEAFLLGGLGLNTVNGVERTRLYIASVQRAMAMPGIEVNLTNHPNGGELFERRDRLAVRGPGDPHPFVDAEGFRAYLGSLLSNAERKLVAEREAGRP